jgi:hypothetical protein
LQELILSTGSKCFGIHIFEYTKKFFILLLYLADMTEKLFTVGWAVEGLGQIKERID